MDIKKVTIRMRKAAKKRFDEINAEYPNAIQADVFDYLLSLEESKLSTGAMMVEKKLKQWLFLGIEKEITMHHIRKAEYPNGLTVGLTTIKKVFALYENEINEHNAKLTK